MPTSLEAIQAQVLGLSISDRSRLIERLIVSLDADEEFESEWDVVADSRQEQLHLGTMVAIPIADAIARLETRFSK